VVDGPPFNEEILLTKSRCVLKKGFWKHWSLDVQEWKTGKKVGSKREKTQEQVNWSRGDLHGSPEP